MTKPGALARSFVGALVGATIACNPPVQPPVEELPTTRVDSGFAFERDAFSFPNFGGRSSTSILTTDLLVRLHGAEAICLKVDPATNSCRSRPIGREYLRQVNEAMKNGRCEGMAVLSGLLAAGDIDRANLGAGTSARDLDIEDNSALGHELAYWFATQFLQDVSISTTKSLDALAATRFLATELAKPDRKTFRIGIARIDENGALGGGHAMLVTAVGPASTAGDFEIFVYDNNHPDAERSIKVEGAANRWSYQASSNPDAEGSLYVGDPANRNLLYLAEIEPRLGEHACTFCLASEAEAAPAMSRVFGSSSVRLNATNDAGQVSGEDNGVLVNDIPGAAVVPTYTELFDDRTPPQIFLPPNTDVSLTLNAASGTDPSDALVFAPGLVAGVIGIELPAGDPALLQVSADHDTLHYEPRGVGGDVVQGVAEETRGEVVVKVTLPSDVVVAEAEIVSTSNGDPILAVHSENDLELPVSIIRATETQEDEIHILAPLPAAGSVTLFVAAWPGGSAEIGASVDEDGDGNGDRSISLADVGAPTNTSCAVVTVLPVDTTEGALDVAIEGGELLVAAGDATLRRFTIDPSAPATTTALPDLDLTAAAGAGATFGALSTSTGRVLLAAGDRRTTGTPLLALDRDDAGVLALSEEITPYDPNADQTLLTATSTTDLVATFPLSVQGRPHVYEGTHGFLIERTDNVSRFTSIERLGVRPPSLASFETQNGPLLLAYTPQAQAAGDQILFWDVTTPPTPTDRPGIVSSPQLPVVQQVAFDAGRDLLFGAGADNQTRGRVFAVDTRNGGSPLFLRFTEDGQTTSALAATGSAVVARDGVVLVASGDDGKTSRIDLFFVPADDPATTDLDERAELTRVGRAVLPAEVETQLIRRGAINPSAPVGYFAAGPAGIVVIDATACYAAP